MTTTIFTNGRIYTGEQAHPFVEAIVVRNERIVDLGSHADMQLQWGRPDVRLVDLQGKMATPGLIDSHLHLGWLGSTFSQLDLNTVTSKDEMLATIKRAANETMADEWLIGKGWDENLFVQGGIPTREELDLVAPHCPVFLNRVCGHAVLVNSKALAIAGIETRQDALAAGLIGSDQELSGLLLETAANVVKKHIPEPDFAQLKQNVKRSIQHAMQHGLTGAHTEDLRDLGGLDQTYRIYDELLNEEELGLRCNLLLYYPHLPSIRERGIATGFGNHRLSIGAVKLFADGALGRRTAYLSAPYADDPTTSGMPIHSAEELLDIMREARSLNMTIAVHTIGDKALDMVLDGLRQFPTVPYRDRIIHTQILRPDQLAALNDESKIVDIQPRFVASDFPWVEERVGKERIQHSYSWKTMMDAGIRCAGGSDAPVEPLDPLLGIHAAVTRKAPGETHDGYYPEQKLSMQEAIRLFTLGGAMATNEEQHKGTLARGKLADMTVYSHDLFAIEPDELLRTQIGMTIVGGKICYAK